jgi:hypothetical protein
MSTKICSHLYDILEYVITVYSEIPILKELAFRNSKQRFHMVAIKSSQMRMILYFTQIFLAIIQV